MGRYTKFLFATAIATSLIVAEGKRVHASDMSMLRSATKTALNDSIDATVASWQTAGFWASYSSYFPTAKQCSQVWNTAANLQLTSVYILDNMLRVMDNKNLSDPSVQAELLNLAHAGVNYARVAGSYASYGLRLAPIPTSHDYQAVKLHSDSRFSIELLVEILEGGPISAGPQPEPPGDPLGR